MLFHYSNVFRVDPLCLENLEYEAKEIGIKNILAEISSEDTRSLEFHKNTASRSVED